MNLPFRKKAHPGPKPYKSTYSNGKRPEGFTKVLQQDGPEYVRHYWPWLVEIDPYLKADVKNEEDKRAIRAADQRARHAELVARRELEQIVRDANREARRAEEETRRAEKARRAEEEARRAEEEKAWYAAQERARREAEQRSYYAPTPALKLKRRNARHGDGDSTHRRQFPS